MLFIAKYHQGRGCHRWRSCSRCQQQGRRCHRWRQDPARRGLHRWRFLVPVIVGGCQDQQQGRGCLLWLTMEGRSCSRWMAGRCRSIVGGRIAGGRIAGGRIAGGRALDGWRGGVAPSLAVPGSCHRWRLSGSAAGARLSSLVNDGGAARARGHIDTAKNVKRFYFGQQCGGGAAPCYHHLFILFGPKNFRFGGT